MLSKNKAIIILLLLLIAIPFGGWYISQPLLTDTTTKDFIITVLNGFWTAYFALIFLGISSLLQKLNTRQVKHYNSLVTLANQLNEMIGVIKDNLYIMDGFKKSIVKGNIHWGSMSPIFIDKSHFDNLADVDLINKVFTLFYQIRKLNDDIKGTQKGYEDLKNAYIQKQITVDHYIANAERIAILMEELELFYEELSENVLVLLATVRIQMRKDKPFTAWLLEKFLYTSGKKISIVEFDEEKTKLQTELELSSNISKKEIKKVTRKKTK